MQKLTKRRGALLAGTLLAAFGTTGAMAFGSFGGQVDQACANLGNPLADQFQPRMNNNCFACHDNGNGGSGAGKSAFRQGNFEFFCPPLVPPAPTCTDADGDGFFAEGGQCGPMDPNDNDPSVFPGAPEICNDGVDNDGNGLIDAQDPACNVPPACTDMDGDGYSAEGGSCGPMDCNDMDPAINPGAPENCSDGIDNNCNGKVDSADPNAVGCPVACTDVDGDGYSVEGGNCGPMDCNDMDPGLNPGVIEICDDGIDNNCDGKVDAADSACQAMDDDDKLKERHNKAKRHHEDNDGDMDEHQNRKERKHKSDKRKRHHEEDDD